MKQDLQDRLRKLGVNRGARSLRPATGSQDSESKIQSNKFPERRGDVTIALEKMFPGGRLEYTVDGPCFIVDKVYPLTYQHGRHRLGDLLEQSTDVATVYCKNERIAELNIGDFLFLDSETTGLAGAGVLAFMVGAAFFELSGTTEV